MRRSPAALRPRRRRSALLAVVAAGALLGACSDDDDGGFPGAVARDGAAGAEDLPPGEGVCALLSPAQLRAATGIEFDRGGAADGACTYTAGDGMATVGVHLTELTADADLALQATSSTCDDGSMVELEVPGADGSFGCTVTGVLVAAGASDRSYVVVTGASLGEAGSPAIALEDLSEVLAQVLEAATAAAET